VSVSWVEPDWPAPGGVRALSTFRIGGASGAPFASLNLGGHVGDVAATVAENRRRLSGAAGLPAEPVWLAQVHGAEVVDLDAAEPNATDLNATVLNAAKPSAANHSAANHSAANHSSLGGIGPADGSFTRQRGRVCAILTADCMPILLTTDSGDVVAAAHAGWRGLAGGVIEATVRALGVPGESLMAWLGPAIGPRHFEVGGEVREALLRSDLGAEAAFALNARGRFLADLGLLARRRLAALGVGRVYGGGRCTFAEGDRYFSHRRDGVTGRQATLIWREPAKL
jgi:polyphenol oxidase